MTINLYKLDMHINKYKIMKYNIKYNNLILHNLKD